MPPDNQAEMPFLDHLEELRWRILWSLLALAIGVGASFYVLLRVEDIVLVLEGPVLPYLGGRKLVYTHPADPFRIIMNLALILGTILASPVIVWQVWRFLSPALYRHEKRVVVPVLMAGVLLFLAGAALSWFVILPLTLRVFTGIQSEALEPMITFRDWYGFATGMSLALGVAFELPIVILLLSLLGVVTPRMLHRFRRFAIVGALVAGAFITPGQDPYSLVMLAGPLYLLYEVSVLASSVVHRWRARRARRDVEAARATADE